MVAILSDFTFTAVHIPGMENVAADALSRLNFQVFSSAAPKCGCEFPGSSKGLLTSSSVPTLDKKWQNLLKHSLSINTQKTYRSADKLFLEFVACWALWME